MRTEIIEILQSKYPEYCMQHIDTADEILRLFNVSQQRELLIAFENYKQFMMPTVFKHTSNLVIDEFLANYSG